MENIPFVLMRRGSFREPFLLNRNFREEAGQPPSQQRPRCHFGAAPAQRLGSDLDTRGAPCAPWSVQQSRPRRCLPPKPNYTKHGDPP